MYDMVVSTEIFGARCHDICKFLMRIFFIIFQNDIDCLPKEAMKELPLLFISFEQGENILQQSERYAI